ncbi:hypothetical protein ISS40_10915 [Candidatus Bathyarchaeota archaeon]|nr:hypothetical protein [Candidatus Bathyarchaeota archaeon]
MVQMEVLALILTGLGIIASILYYASVLRNANRTQLMQLETRQASFFMQIYNRMLDKDFMEVWHKVLGYDYSDPEAAMRRYDSEVDSEERVNVDLIAQWYEGLGVLVKEGLLDIHLIAVMFPLTVINGWNALGPMITEMQKTSSSRGSNFEYLYDELMRYLEEHPELRA